MSEELTDIPSEEKKSGKKPMLIGAILAVLAAAGGYFLGGKLNLSGDSQVVSEGESEDSHPADWGGNIDRIPIDSIIVSLPPSSGHRHLRVTVQLEVDPEHLEEVQSILPRFIDMMNGYLRAVDVSDFQEPAILHQIKAHLLARMQILAPKDSIKGLLIMEFILT